MNSGKADQVTNKSVDEEVSISNAVKTFSHILEDLICQETEYPEEANANFSTSIFYSKKPPKIGLRDYLIRIVKYSGIQESTLIMSLILLDSISRTHISLSNLNIHRLLITAIVLSTKLNEDEIYKNDYYASLGGIKLELLNNMETELLNLFDWRLHITTETFESYKKLVESESV